MFNKSGRYYDLIYSGKNYAEEAGKIAAAIRAECPSARTILDVGCGTGEHAKYLSGEFRVDGIDLEPQFVEIARRKVPQGDFRVGDMICFDLGKRYDAVLCLFSAIGYMHTPERLTAALTCFKNHLNPGGVVLIEPWLTPEVWRVGVPHMLTVDRPDIKICRMNVSALEGRVSKIRFHYLVATRDGVDYFVEDHNLTMYTVEEMLDCFKRAGLGVRHDPQGIAGRGLYIARQGATAQ